MDPELLRAMKRAGCVSVNFGVESGDDGILRLIKKGVSTDQAVRALEWARREGLRTIANFMLGFPQEGPEQLERTLRFLERIAPLVDSFGTLGVVVPYPGTPIYDEFHARYGFTDWWLRAESNSYELPPPFKLSGREMPQPDFLRTVEAYNRRRYDGDLMDLLVGFCRARPMHPVRLDNRSLDSLMARILARRSGCHPSSCPACRLCDRWAEEHLG